MSSTTGLGARTPMLAFLGGAGTVTGSKFLIEQGPVRVLVDCGLFQGRKDLRLRNWEPLPVDPALISAVVLSHAHLDHCGYLPALVRGGFRRTTWATAGTCALAEIVLRDSAHLLEEEAAHANAHGYAKHRPARPLYSVGDAEAAIRTLNPLPFGEWDEIAPGVEAQFRTAGHILGSSSVSVRLTAHGGRTVTFSGDLGRPSHPLLEPPPPPEDSDVILVESTYGNRAHEDEGIEEFLEAIRRTVARGGTVLIPAFAVDRTEVLLMTLAKHMLAGDIPQVPVFVDSPMALAALRVYREAISADSPEIRQVFRDEMLDPFDPGQLTEAHTVEDSMRLNSPVVPSIVVSASGMATGGRVLHHLRHLLPDPKNTVILAGFQAEGTRGRTLADGASTVKMFGRYVAVRADVVAVDAFSVHADADELIGWLAQAPREPEIVYVVHGEPDASRALQDRITSELGWAAAVPKLGERVRLD